MYNINPPRSIFLLYILLYLIIAASVLNYWYPAEYAINGHWHPYYYQKSNYIALVPNWQKLLKDAFLLLLLFFSLLLRSSSHYVKFYKDKLLNITYTLCLLLLGIALAKNIDSDLSYSSIIVSLRPIVFVVSLFIFCHRHFNYYYLIQVLRGLNLLALLQVVYAILQRYTAVLNNGIGWLDCAGIRSTGTLAGPNSLGLFLALCFYTNIYILPWHKCRYFLLLLYTIGIFLSGSRTSFLIIILLSIEIVFSKFSTTYRKNTTVFAKLFGVSYILPVLLCLFPFIKYLNTRAGASESNFGGRLEIFLNYISQVDIASILLGSYLGYGSNSIIIQEQATQTYYHINAKITFISDSTWTYLIAQFGLVGMLLFVAIVYLLWRKYLSCRYSSFIPMFSINIGRLRIGFMIYFLCSSATIILFEFYAVLPILVSLLFALRFRYLPKENT